MQNFWALDNLKQNQASFNLYALYKFAKILQKQKNGKVGIVFKDKVFDAFCHSVKKHWGYHGMKNFVHDDKNNYIIKVGKIIAKLTDQNNAILLKESINGAFNNKTNSQNTDINHIRNFVGNDVKKAIIALKIIHLASYLNLNRSDDSAFFIPLSQDEKFGVYCHQIKGLLKKHKIKDDTFLKIITDATRNKKSEVFNELGKAAIVVAFSDQILQSANIGK